MDEKTLRETCQRLARGPEPSEADIEKLVDWARRARARTEELEDRALRLEHIVVSAYDSLLQCGDALPLHGLTALNLLKVTRPTQLGELKSMTRLFDVCQHGYALNGHCDSCGRDCWGNHL